jgi:hypothetical protein
MLPGRLDAIVILLQVGPDDRVIGAETNLLSNPLGARTEAGYAATGLYDMTVRLLGNRCPELTPLNLYRFFENTVKPNVVRTQQDSGGIFSVHRLLTHADRIPYCGVHFTFTQMRRFSGAEELGFARNVHEIASIRLD